MKVLGIDPGTQVTGYGIILRENNRLIAVQYGTIRPPVAAPLSKRYKIIFDGIQQIIKDFSPDVIAVESSFYLQNMASAMKLSQVRGVVLLAASQANLDIYEYAPRRVKQAVCGRGGATKQQVQKMVQTLLALDRLPTPADASDALAVAICHIQSINSPKPAGRRT
mgnify:CR=1 FL=1